MAFRQRWDIIRETTRSYEKEGGLIKRLSSRVVRSMCIYIYIILYIHVDMYVCMYVCLSVCNVVQCNVMVCNGMYVCIHTYRHIYIYIHQTCCIFIIKWVGVGQNHGEQRAKNGTLKNVERTKHVAWFWWMHVPATSSTIHQFTLKSWKSKLEDWINQIEEQHWVYSIIIIIIIMIIIITIIIMKPAIKRAVMEANWALLRIYQFF